MLASVGFRPVQIETFHCTCGEDHAAVAGSLASFRRGNKGVTALHLHHQRWYPVNHPGKMTLKDTYDAVLLSTVYHGSIGSKTNELLIKGFLGDVDALKASRYSTYNARRITVL